MRRGKVDPLAKEREELRGDGQRMLWSGDYGEMVRLYSQLCGMPDAPAKDHLWRGHAYQLASRWREAVAAYKAALAGMEAEIAGGELRAHRRSQREAKWAELLMQIGRLELVELKDPTAAAKTLGRSLTHVPEGARPIDDLAGDAARAVMGLPPADKVDPKRRLWYHLMMPMACQRYLAEACARAGRTREAVEAWTRIRLCALAYKAGMADVDPAHLAGLWATLPPNKPLPPMPLFVVLGPERPEAVFRPAEGGDRLACWTALPNRFAVVPTPGRAIASLTVRVACDRPLRGGGEVSCRLVTPARHGSRSVVLSARRVDDKRAALAGRQRFEVAAPFDADVLFVDLPPSRRVAEVASVTLRATFRPVGRGKAPPPGTVKVSHELLPAGGTRMLDGRKNASWDNLAPGRHTFAYTHANSAGRYEEAFEVQPGRRYGLSLNLASPFRPVPLNGQAFTTSSPAHASLLKLPGGGWLMAYTAGGPQRELILLTGSRDGVTWQKPWAFAHNSIFQTSRPSLAVDDGGAIWMVFFSKRLDTAHFSSGHFHLWATESPDGRTWSLPKPVRTGQWSQYHQTAHLARGAKGKLWLFVNNLCARGDSPAAIADPKPLALGLPSRVHPENPHATFDKAGRCHLVYDDFGRGIYYTRSDDMATWLEPVRLVAAEKNSRARFAQLVLDGSRAALICETTRGSRLMRGELTAEGVRLGRPTVIANHWIPLNGAKAVRDGKSLLLPAGKGANVWLLRARFDEVLSAGPAKGK